MLVEIANRGAAVKSKALFAVFALILASALGLTACSSDSAEETGAPITVTVVAQAPDVESFEFLEETVGLSSGDTVYDALMATSFRAVTVDSEYGKYVDAIGGLANGAYGDASGWIYIVNGEEAAVACDDYELENGDSVQWSYLV